MRLEIDRELAQGKSKTEIAQKFDVPYHSVDYHARHHLSRQLLQSYERKGRLVSDELVSQFEDLFVKAREMHERSLARDSVSGDALALRALGEQRAILDTMCRILALLVETKAMEQQERARQEPVDLDLSDLTDDELDLAISLGFKAQGRKDKIPPRVARQEFPKAQTVDESPKLIAKPEPPLKHPVKPVLKADTQPEISNPTPNPTLEPEKPQPKTLPPAPTVKIPGGSRSGTRVARHRLARKAYSRPVEENRSPTGGGFWFPGEKK